MILAIDTSTMVCRTWLVTDSGRHADEWQADRQLGDRLLGYLRGRLNDQGAMWDDITAIIAYRGPGSFTGLRIGLTVMNTIADSKQIPIVGETGDDWLEVALERLKSGQDDKLVMPLYGREATITKPRK
jgi:tRNA threonylcarbamoyladenosine biosynthesis protein TsaB